MTSLGKHILEKSLESTLDLHANFQDKMMNIKSDQDQHTNLILI